MLLQFQNDSAQHKQFLNLQHRTWIALMAPLHKIDLSIFLIQLVQSLLAMRFEDYYHFVIMLAIYIKIFFLL